MTELVKHPELLTSIAKGISSGVYRLGKWVHKQSRIVLYGQQGAIALPVPEQPPLQLPPPTVLIAKAKCVEASEQQK